MPLSSGGVSPVDYATASDYRAGTSPAKVLVPQAVWAATAEVGVAFASTVTLDLNALINGNFVATSNFTMANPLNMLPGKSGRIRILQDTTGSRTITFGSFWRRSGADSNTLSTTAGAIDILYYDVLDASTIIYTLRKGIV